MNYAVVEDCCPAPMSSSRALLDKEEEDDEFNKSMKNVPTDIALLLLNTV